MSVRSMIRAISTLQLSGISWKRLFTGTCRPKDGGEAALFSPTRKSSAGFSQLTRVFFSPPLALRRNFPVAKSSDFPRDTDFFGSTCRRERSPSSVSKNAKCAPSAARMCFEGDFTLGLRGGACELCGGCGPVRHVCTGEVEIRKHLPDVRFRSRRLCDWPGGRGPLLQVPSSS